MATSKKNEKPLFVEPDVHKMLKDLSEDTGIPMTRLATKMIREGVERELRKLRALRKLEL
jgi:hypothetical protein